MLRPSEKNVRSVPLKPFIPVTQQKAKQSESVKPLNAYVKA